jgi:hypothetical protein
MPKYTIEIARKMKPDFTTIVMEAHTRAQAEDMALDDARMKAQRWEHTGEVDEVYVVDCVCVEGVDP